MTFSVFYAIMLSEKEIGGFIMKGYVLDYIDENEFKKLERALKKYNMLAFKKINFEYYPALRNGKFLGELVKKNKQLLMSLNYQVTKCLHKSMEMLN